MRIPEIFPDHTDFTIPAFCSILVTDTRKMPTSYTPTMMGSNFEVPFT